MVAGLDADKVERYLKSLLGNDIALLSLTHLGEPPDEALGKSYGYGRRAGVNCRAGNGEHRSAMLHTMSRGAVRSRTHGRSHSHGGSVLRFTRVLL